MQFPVAGAGQALLLFCDSFAYARAGYVFNAPAITCALSYERQTKTHTHVFINVSHVDRSQFWLDAHGERSLNVV